MKQLRTVSISGKEVLPIVEGGKGISLSNGFTAGAFAACGAVGTISGVNADRYDANGNIIPSVFLGKTPAERHRELITYAIEAGIQQAKIAYEIASGKGRIHINILWEMGGAEEVIAGILEKASHFVHGVTCGGGMPYKLSEITSRFKVFSIPIVSSARAFEALWKRAYHKFSDWIGAVVYEDPWLAGGHNGISNAENPSVPEGVYGRVLALRNFMREVGLSHVPIIVAGGVWCLSEWENFIDNKELGDIAFQFGTRPLLTRESPSSDEIKRYLVNAPSNEVSLNRFSPTGMYSSAVRNDFLRELEGRAERQVQFSIVSSDEFSFPVKMGPQTIFIKGVDEMRVLGWMENGFFEPMRTPDDTVIFVSPEVAMQIRADQRGCMGCLSSCLFSGWSQHGHKIKPDPRKFCIQKTLQRISHGGDPERELMFAGHSFKRFSTDPFYRNGFIPSIAELVDRIKTGA